MGFQVNQLLFADKFLLVFSEQVDHSGEAWRDRLFQFGRQEDGNRREVDYLLLLEVLHTYGVDVPVEYVGGNEKRLHFVVLLLMQVKYFLNSIRSVMGSKEFLG